MGSASTQQETTDNLGFDADSWQLAGGGQIDVGNAWHLGGALSYEGRNLDAKDSNASSEGHQFQAGVSAKRSWDATELSGSLAIGYGDFDNDRALWPGAAVSGTQQLWLFSGQVRVAHLIQRGRWVFKPRLDLGVDVLTMDGFNESGTTDFRLRVDGQRDTFVNLQPAIDIATEFETAGGLLIRPKVSLGITQFLGNTPPSVTGRFAVAPGNVPSFTARTGLDQTRFDVAAVVDLFTRQALMVRAEVFGSWSDHTESYGGGPEGGPVVLSGSRAMGQEYLATGFTDVDGRADAHAYAQCLTLLDSLPYFRDYKARSYELLGLRPGLSVLELGCGLGDDAIRMAARVGPDGCVVGVDASMKLIAQALARLPADLPVRFARADARRLPLRADSVDRCRVDRTLQHIADPEQAIRELVRVLKPGGSLLAYDNDWGTFAVSGQDVTVTEQVATTWVEAITNRWIGRYLQRYFLEAGLERVVVEPSVSVLTDFALADRVYNLRQTVERLVTAGRLAPADATRWLSDLQAQTRSGGFLCSLTAYTVVGVKPGSQW